MLKIIQNIFFFFRIFKEVMKKKTWSQAISLNINFLFCSGENYNKTLIFKKKKTEEKEQTNIFQLGKA